MLKTRLRKENIGHILTVISYVCIVLMCIVHSIEAGYYVNFAPINGTFQNFNPVRRLLSGQIPYKDFTDYLGLGHLYTGTVFTLLFGGNYKASLIAFWFLAILSFSLISIVVASAVFDGKKGALNYTIVMLFIILVKPEPIIKFIGLNDEIKNSLMASLGTGNSARFLRGMILPLSVIVFSLVFKLMSQMKYRIIRGNAVFISAGIVAGICLPWSNDYGISCWLCLHIFMILLCIIKGNDFGKCLKNIFVVFISSIVTFFIVVTILTGGHFAGWCEATFGTGGYQSWYYNSAKSFFVYDFDHSFLIILQLLVVLIYVIQIIRNKNDNKKILRFIIPAYMNLACFLSVNEYKLLSGGDSKEVAITVLVMTISCEFLRVVGSYLNKPIMVEALSVVLLVSSVLWLMLTVKTEIWAINVMKSDGIRIDSLGGNMTKLGEDLLEANEFLDGNSIFSTYASAQEVIENKFQPSGTDYIIHVLGDEKREKYLEKFRNSDFEYAVTINKKYNDWEYWIERANWFFYRELYANYHPVFENSYEVYWARNNDGIKNCIMGDYEVKVEREKDAVAKLIIDTEESINGVADVYLDYSVDKNSNNWKSFFMFQRMLRVQPVNLKEEIKAECDHNFLRSKSNEYIPVNIVDGHGEVVLSANPEDNSILTVNRVECGRIFTGFDIINE